VRHGRFARYAAPIAFLAAITIGVLVVRAGFEHGKHHTGKPPATTTVTTTKKHVHIHKKGHVETYTVESGDTFGSIASKLGTTVIALEHLNPGIDPTTLSVGEKIRVK
jgi:LysM repeat protein